VAPPALTKPPSKAIQKFQSKTTASARGNVSVSNSLPEILVTTTARASNRRWDRHNRLYLKVIVEYTRATIAVCLKKQQGL